MGGLAGGLEGTKKFQVQSLGKNAFGESLRESDGKCRG